MSNDLDDLGHKGLVRCDLAVPVLDILPQDDGDKGVELEVDIIPAGQGRQKFLDGGWGGSSLLEMLRAEDAPNEEHGGFVR